MRGIFSYYKDKTSAVKNTAPIIGWVCFAIAAVIYLIATVYFGLAFAEVIAENNLGEGVGRAVVFLVFLVAGSLVYAVDAGVSIIGFIVANVKRGEKKFFFAPIITLVLSVLTWLIFVLICICL